MYPSLEEAAARQGQNIPTPTAKVIRSFKADTRRALAEARTAAGTRLKGKQKASQAEGTSSAAEEAMDALLKEMRAEGTPASGGESGTLKRAAGTSSSSGQPSATPQGVGDKTSSAEAATVDTTGKEENAGGAEQPSERERSRDQFPGGDGEDDL